MALNSLRGANNVVDLNLARVKACKKYDIYFKYLEYVGPCKK
jgi:hypothetical protein